MPCNSVYVLNIQAYICASSFCFVKHLCIQVNAHDHRNICGLIYGEFKLMWRIPVNVYFRCAFKLMS
jgi:hypothetical protein